MLGPMRYSLATRWTLPVLLLACGPAPGDTEDGSTGTNTSTTDTSTTTVATTTTDVPTGAGTSDDTTAGTSTTENTTGEPPPIDCVVTPGDHSAACPAPDCLIEVDLEIRCDDDEFAAPGMGVAPAPEATWFVTSSSNQSYLFRADAGGAERVEGVVDMFPRNSFVLALAPDGAPHLAVDATTFAAANDYPGGLEHRALVDGAWTSSLAYDVPDHYLPPTDLKVDTLGRPHLFINDPPPEGYVSAIQDGGTWDSHVIETPGAGPYNRFLLGPDDAEIAIAAPDRLTAIVDGQTVQFGSPISQQSVVFYQAASAPAGPLLGAAVHVEDRIEVAWWPTGPNPDPGKITMAGTTDLQGTCGSTGPVDPNEPCPGPCNDSSSGMRSGAFSFARTADGVGWLAWVTTELDIDYHFELSMLDDVDFFCQAIADSDHSTGVLHLTRVPLGSGAPAEVLTLPMSDLDLSDLFTSSDTRVSAIELDAFGSDLAIAVRQRADAGPFIRLLRIDTLAIP